MKLRITISKYHLWYLCQISLQIMLLPILIHHFFVLIVVLLSVTGCASKQMSHTDTCTKLSCNKEEMIPNTPCFKPLMSDKKHFIIHTPEHDKVTLLQGIF